MASVFLLGIAQRADALTNLCVGGSPNALVQVGEDCDDGGVDADSCTNLCRWAACGDGVICTDAAGADQCANSPFLDGIETCDVVGGADTPTCDGVDAPIAQRCTAAACGDSYVNAAAGETCDVAADSATCDGPGAGLNACTARVCGDGWDSTATGIEQCDDGNTSNNDTCVTIAGDCKIAACGDGFVCSAGGCTTGPSGTPEDCDNGTTGNSATCDGAGAGVAQRCSVVDCGDGYVNSAAGETCDTLGGANTSTCDGDSAGANSCTARTCGDGYFNSVGGLEACDDGNGSNNDPCLNTCDIAVCNDGFVCSAGTCNTTPKPYVGPEVCDDGNLLNTDSCQTNCTAASCGDGIVQPGEQCDQGKSFCGAGTPFAGDVGEECTTQLDCRGVCVAGPNVGAPCTDPSVVADCGAGSTAATCDWDIGTDDCPSSGNRDDLANDCRSTCLNDYCGDGVVDAGEQCDDGDLNNNDACVIHAIGGAINLTNTAAKNCGFNMCGDGTACTDVTSCPSVPGNNIEACDDGNTTQTDACIILVIGGDATGPNQCDLNVCGDGYVKAGSEECDDGVSNANAIDSCKPVTCKKPTCGDGFNDGAIGGGDEGNTVAESCDNGVSNGDTKPCTSTCATAACGDGKTCSDATCTSGNVSAPGLNPGPEECDDGNKFCILGTVPNGTPCTSLGTNVAECGPGGQCQSDGDGCTGPLGTSLTGLACQNEGCGDGVRNLAERLPGRCDDGNLVPGDGCDAGCYDEVCGNARLGYQCAAPAVWGPPALNPLGDADCGGAITVEPCDDGNTNALDACRTVANLCVVNFCGDGITNNAEECDDGATVNNDYCTASCNQAECGDGVVCSVGGGATQCAYSTNLDDTEDCDSSAGADTATCNGAAGGPQDGCQTSTCGDGYANAADDEECDDGGTSGNLTFPVNSADGCRTGCIAPACGDNIEDPGFGEQCDDGVTGSVDCNVNCCGTGNDSYIDSFAGYTCQDAILDGCSTGGCTNASKITKLNTKAGTLVSKADALVAVNKLPQASRKARAAGKRLAKAGVLAASGCTGPSLTCLQAELDLTRQVVLELEANLLGNNP